MVYKACIFFIQSIYQLYLKFRIGWAKHRYAMPAQSFIQSIFLEIDTNRIGWARHLAYFCPWSASAKFHPACPSILYLHYGCRFRYDTGAFVCLLHLRVSDFPCTTFMLSHIETHCLKSSLLIWLGIEPNITDGSRRRSTNGVHITICFNMVKP